MEYHLIATHVGLVQIEKNVLRCIELGSILKVKNNIEYTEDERNIMLEMCKTGASDEDILNRILEGRGLI